MGERKVINKYYPPDFDPSKLKKPKPPDEKTVRTRMMLPFTCKCSVCGTYLHIGTKFNMRMEIVPDEEYLGIEIRRFYFKCSSCASEITMKTDPKNHDYVCESNASRQYDERRDLEAAMDVLREMKASEDEDPMRFLESRTYESRREMDIMDALSDLIQINKVQAKVDYDNVLSRVREMRQKKEGELEEMPERPKNIIKRIDEDEADRHIFQKHKKILANIETSGPVKRERQTGTGVFSRIKPKIIVKKQVMSE